MGRQKNDGKGRIGGRAKGTPNKITSTVKEWILGVVNGHRVQFEKDLDKMEAWERVRVITNLLQYVTPKMQSVSAEEMVDAEYKRLEEFLDVAPDEVIEEIVNRINRLKDEQRGKAAKD